MKQLVQDQYKVSYKDFYNLYIKLKSGKITAKQVSLLEKVTDIDYIHKVVDDEKARVFMADFIGEWFAISWKDRTKESAARLRSKERDLFTQCRQVNTEEDQDVITAAVRINELPSDVNAYKQTKDDGSKVRKLNHSYSINDYMPSKNFNPDAIIDMIDIQNEKNRANKELRNRKDRYLRSISNKGVK